MLTGHVWDNSDGLLWVWDVLVFGSGKLFWFMGGLLVLFSAIFGQFQIAFPSLIQLRERCLRKQLGRGKACPVTSTRVVTEVPWGQGTSSEFSGLKEHTSDLLFSALCLKNHLLSSKAVMRGDAGQASTGCGTQLAV